MITFLTSIPQHHRSSCDCETQVLTSQEGTSMPETLNSLIIDPTGIGVPVGSKCIRVEVELQDSLCLIVFRNYSGQ